MVICKIYILDNFILLKNDIGIIYIKITKNQNFLNISLYRSLNDNQITSIPKEIENLKNLTYL